MKNKKIFIYDLETFPDLFTATFLDRDSDEVRKFVISKDKDQRKELFEFLNTEVAGLIGYNSIHFDAQIIEYMYRYPDCTVYDIRRYAEIITSDNNRRPDVPEWKLRHKHLDLFRALSLSTKAKRTGLKWCEFGMDLDNIEDLPSQGEGDNWEEMVLAYNYNDVYATKELFKRNIKDIQLRQDITKREGVNVMNSTEPDISKKLFLKWLSNALNISRSDLASMGTDRREVIIKDIIFPYIKFNTSLFQEVYDKYNELVAIQGTKFEKEIHFKGIDVTYALGGLHGAPKKPTIFESNDEYIIKSLDVVSYYPNLAIRNKLHPAHLPQKEFCDLYESLFNERRSIPKSDPRNYVLKIALNALYGMTNDEFSFLRDRQFTLAICINGQLLLSMLFEMLTSQIPDSKMVMLNTDGGEILIPRKYEKVYNSICKDWETLTNLELEFDDYKSLIIRDVNNYIGIYTNGKTKCKGAFEYENIPLYKNKSHNIIRIAVYEYFVNNIPVEETILNHNNIFDFCAGKKASRSGIRGKSWYELHSIKNGELFIEKLSKTVRYFISTKGKYLLKRYEDNTIEQGEAPKLIGKLKKDWKITYFNKKFDIEDFKDYNIDYSYYISRAKDWINLFKEEPKLF